MLFSPAPSEVSRSASHWAFSFERDKTTYSKPYDSMSSLQLSRVLLHLVRNGLDYLRVTGRMCGPEASYSGLERSDAFQAEYQR